MTNSGPEKTPYIDKIIKEYLRGLNSFYPGIRLIGRYSLFSGEQPYNCRLNLTLRNSNVEGTDYASTDQKYLIHYTSSLQNLFNILNSGFLRLSNLSSLNDPQELLYMAKEINWIETSQLNLFRKSFHSVSFCGIHNLAQPDKFPMWRLYGGDGYGAAIVFEILNPNTDWHKYMLARIQYGNSAERDKYIDFLRFHSQFQIENNRPITNLPEAVFAFMGMHKNDIWNYEEEIRLISHYEYEEHSLEPKTAQNQAAKLRHSIGQNGNPYSYLELPLFGSTKYIELEKFYNNNGVKDNFIKSLPILKINKVVLGYRHSLETLLDCESIISNVSNNYKHDIEIINSYLKEYMK
ncbi:DUF2971 domain-containing protein [Pedobacter alpinus]|uniref:DUF2971 domain-containing protein n=1 Tax=Pedobacter alpinus TaxID=1590643 RepID=A0ABW5TLV8_9SPHI